MKSIALLTLFTTANAQCGPNKDKPYPSNSETCPTYTKNTADGMAAETNTAPGRGGGSSCTALPCAASLLGDVALTTVAGTGMDGATFAVGENIYGPFEAGFGAQQDFILKELGCTDANVASAYVEGGVDTSTAEQIVAKACGVTLPRTESSTYISLIDECGGHTRDYHFHERLSCLYKEEGAHSTKVGEGLDKKGIYGKWEDYATKTLPLLDACGGHFGVTPDSDGKKIYHYHVQVNAPFTIGCFGPAKNDAGEETLVTLEQCRSLYGGCTSTAVDLVTTTGTISYKYWCPCYDADGSSVGTKELPVFANTTDGVVTCKDCSSGTTLPTTGASTEQHMLSMIAAGVVVASLLSLM